MNQSIPVKPERASNFELRALQIIPYAGSVSVLLKVWSEGGERNKFSDAQRDQGAKFSPIDMLIHGMPGKRPQKGSIDKAHTYFDQ